MKHLLITTIAAVLVVGCGKPNIWEAATTGNIEAVKQHLANGTDVNAQNGPVGRTPLHEAALRGHKEVVELVIDKDADVNAKDWMSRTPLHNAALDGHKEIVELLIAKGADVNAKGESGFYKGQTPLDWAEQFEDDSPEDKANIKETAALLRKYGGKTGAELKVEGN